MPKPIFRSSAIFPVFQKPGISSRILFMGYWLLKRNIREIASVVTLRAEKGEELFRSTELITKAKCYRIELFEILEKIHHTEDFVGSLEVEFYSSAHLVFPFPAVVINYYGKSFSTVVHTAQRVYNDFQDFKKNSETEVPESGFNIYADDDHEPFVGLINGLRDVKDSKIHMLFFNTEGDTYVHETHLGRLEPYETRVIYPARNSNIRNFLKGKVGSVKLQFHVNWIFPRLVVGNIQKSNQSMVITHSYYDCTNAKKESDYWRKSESKYHPASLMIPIAGAFTNVYFYPIYSPSKLAFDIEIYDKEGNCLKNAKSAITLTAPSLDYKQLRLRELCMELDRNDLAARIIVDPIDSDRIPARIKVAFDVGMSDLMLPCNICTNLQPFNPNLEGKPHTFRWFPILADYPGATGWVMNSSPEVNYQTQAEVELTFYRELDDEVLKRTIVLPPHGFYVIKPSEDKELESFFMGNIGWVTAISTNPYTTTYYFVMHPSGVVGGDHGF